MVKKPPLTLGRSRGVFLQNALKLYGSGFSRRESIQKAMRLAGRKPTTPSPPPSVH